MVKQETTIKVEDLKVLMGPEYGTDYHLVHTKCHCPFPLQNTQRQPNKLTELASFACLMN